MFSGTLYFPGQNDAYMFGKLAGPSYDYNIAVTKRLIKATRVIIVVSVDPGGQSGTPASLRCELSLSILSMSRQITDCSCLVPL